MPKFSRPRSMPLVGLGLVLLSVACDAEPVPPTTPDVQELATPSTRVDEVLTAAVPDRHDREAIPLRLELVDLPTDGRYPLARGEHFDVRITNDSDDAGAVELEVERMSEAARSREVVATVELGAHRSVTVTVPASVLGLRPDADGSSANVGFRARLANDHGGGYASARTVVRVRPEADGWVLYGDDASGSIVDDSPLPAEMKAQLHAMLEGGPTTVTLPDGTVLHTATPTLGSIIIGPASADALTD